MDSADENEKTNAHEFTVSQISQAVKATVEQEFGYVRVRGEVGRLSRPASGHIYFDLKDDKAVLSAVAWKGVASRWRFQPEQGLEIVATGRLTTFPGQSRYQIIVESVEPAGAGALMALLEERRRKLAAEGLFEEGRKQSLPYLPRVIGVVTSPSGAVIRDILHRLADRFPTHVVVWPVRVQGTTCASEVARAVEGFNMLPPDGGIARPDLIIVARGGGSVEDLWGFNEEEVVRAIAESSIPVISAIGHETDMTLADFAADRRAPTPTGAAEMAVPVRAELIAYVRDLGNRQFAAARRILVSRRDRLRAASAGLPRPADILAQAYQRLDLAQTRLIAALGRARQQKALQLARVAPRLSSRALLSGFTQQQRRLSTLSLRLRNALAGLTRNARSEFAPLSLRLAPAMGRHMAAKRAVLEQRWQLVSSLGYPNVLRRGFVLVSDEKGNVVRQGEGLLSGQEVVLQFSDTRRHARIADGGQPVKPAGRRPAKAGRKKPLPPDDGQASLF